MTCCAARAHHRRRAAHRRRRATACRRGSTSGSRRTSRSCSGRCSQLAAAEDVTGIARGIAFQLVEALGVLERQKVAEDVKGLDQAARATLRKYGVRFGAYHIYMPALLKPAPRVLADAALGAQARRSRRRKGLDDLQQLAAQRPHLDRRPTRTIARSRSIASPAIASAASARCASTSSSGSPISSVRRWLGAPGAPGPRPAGALDGFGFTVTVRDDLARRLLGRGLRLDPALARLPHGASGRSRRRSRAPAAAQRRRSRRARPRKRMPARRQPPWRRCRAGTGLKRPSPKRVDRSRARPTSRRWSRTLRLKLRRGRGADRRPREASTDRSRDVAESAEPRRGRSADDGSSDRTMPLPTQPRRRRSQCAPESRRGRCRSRRRRAGRAGDDRGLAAGPSRASAVQRGRHGSAPRRERAPAAAASPQPRARRRPPAAPKASAAAPSRRHAPVAERAPAADAPKPRQRRDAGPRQRARRRGERPERSARPPRPERRRSSAARRAWRRPSQRGDARPPRSDRPDRDPELRAKYIEGREGRGDGATSEPDPNSPFAKLRR